MPPDDKTMNDRAAGARLPWRAMAEDDLWAVHALSMRVHPDHPERAEVLAEKFRLYPRGCFVLTPGQGIRGYCFSHPWTRGMVPALDGFLEDLPEKPTTYYVHDLTIDELARGQGQGRAVVPLLLEAAQSVGLRHLSLVAVNRRGPFWRAAGFSRTTDEALQAAARAKYDAGAVHMERLLP
jgi:ribosomal protein S18 acetylase RimI-like enzyme